MRSPHPPSLRILSTLHGSAGNKLFFKKRGLFFSLHSSSIGSKRSTSLADSPSISSASRPAGSQGAAGSRGPAAAGPYPWAVRSGAGACRCILASGASGGPFVAAGPGGRTGAVARGRGHVAGAARCPWDEAWAVATCRSQGANSCSCAALRIISSAAGPSRDPRTVHAFRGWSPVGTENSFVILATIGISLWQKKSCMQKPRHVQREAVLQGTVSPFCRNSVGVSQSAVTALPQLLVPPSRP